MKTMEGQLGSAPPVSKNYIEGSAPDWVNYPMGSGGLRSWHSQA